MKATISQFLTVLRELTNHKDRHIKGHSKALLKRLQDFNPQDDTQQCTHEGEYIFNTIRGEECNKCTPYKL